MAHYRNEAHIYNEALVLELDTETGKTVPWLRYTSPPEVTPDHLPSILFKAGTRTDRHFYLCTQTEVLVYDLVTRAQTAYLSLPFFNDLHHVTPTPEGTLLIANTGLDMVVEVTLSGEVVQMWNTLGEGVWDRFDPDTDYRKIASTKPHRSHPNYVFIHGKDRWVTRFEQRDALCLTDPSKRIEIGGERVHDGVVCGDRVFFTCVDGHLVVADLKTRTRTKVIDLNAIRPKAEPMLGWCRGIALLDEDHVFIAFSRLRVTKFHQKVLWAQRRLGMKQDVLDRTPTRLVLYNVRTGTFCREFNLEPDDMNAIFSVHIG